MQIEQKFFPLDDTEKDQRLWKILDELPDESKVVTFANTKRRVDHLARECWNAGFGVSLTATAQTSRDRLVWKGDDAQGVLSRVPIGEREVVSRLDSPPQGTRSLSGWCMLTARVGVCVRAGASAIHGDRTQAERNDALTKFSQGEWPLMFATDVAARGLDITGTRSHTYSCVSSCYTWHPA